LYIDIAANTRSRIDALNAPSVVRIQEHLTQDHVVRLNFS